MTRVRDMKYRARFEGFRSLMPRKVNTILLVSTLYDAFVLEEDGSLGERLWDKYMGMGLTMPPRFMQVSSAQAALETIRRESIDLVLTMTRLSDQDPLAFAGEVKKIAPSLPVILLATDPGELGDLPAPQDRGAVDKIFLWNNHSEILLAVVKYVEDLWNVEHDTKNGGVRVILVIEDSVQYISELMPVLYRVIMNMTRNLVDDGLDGLHKQLRMRSRAKVLHAETYEEGLRYFKKYRSNLIGVVSDLRFWRNERIDPQAGFDLAREFKQLETGIPIMLYTAEPSQEARQVAEELQTYFLDKNAGDRNRQLKNFLSQYVGLGDFIFRMPDGRVVGKADNVHDLKRHLQHVPIESVVYHASRNDFSHWLAARTELVMANRLRPRKMSEYNTQEEAREHIVSIIEEVLADKQSDVIAEFSAKKLAQDSRFLHLGEGSMGGKGRGIAFMRFLLSKLRLEETYPDVRIEVPHTVVIGANEFERFVTENGLRPFAMKCDDMHEIAQRFMEGRVHRDLRNSLKTYIRNVKRPIAVRSSSILEDSHLQPFAGLYATYMLPNSDKAPEARLKRLLTAIKLVWASTFGPDPKSYFRSTVHRQEDEKMAVVIQELVGNHHSKRFYPTFSGVAQSYNFYPIGPMQPEDGLVHLALGLGKMVVEGGKVLRFCPRYPDVLPQFPTNDEWLRFSQKQFYALDMVRPDIENQIDPDATLRLHELEQAEKDGVLRHVASTYYGPDDIIRDSLSVEGPRLVSFANIRKRRVLPLAEIASTLLEHCREALGGPIEIEFAVNMDSRLKKPVFAVLQVRPLITKCEPGEVEIGPAHLERAWCYSKTALGNGLFEDVRDVVYVPPERFDKAKTAEIAKEIGEINKSLEAEDRKYILLGFGRWGSSDPWLGIGVTWSQISSVKLFVEVALPDFRIDPSQGTHFYQNMTSRGIGYLSVPDGKAEEWVDWKWLESIESFKETKHLRHLRFDDPIPARIDGREGAGAILKPDVETENEASSSEQA